MGGTGTDGTTTYVTDFAPHVFKLAAAATLAHPVNGLNAGDTIRVGDEFRRIVHNTGSFVTAGTTNHYQMTSGLQKTMATGAKVFKQNGMMYDITFESGCRTHADCRNNGIDENESDGPDATSDIEGNDEGAFCHAGGACICSGASYFGDGCTTDGRDDHAAPKKYVSGNLQNLQCDKSSLTPSRPILWLSVIKFVLKTKFVMSFLFHQRVYQLLPMRPMLIALLLRLYTTLKWMNHLLKMPFLRITISLMPKQPSNV